MEEEKKSKLESRKFMVWLIWLMIAIAVIAYCVTVVIVTKEATETMGTLLEKVLGWFFGISMMYIGCNAGQKVGLNIAEAMKEKKEEENE